MTGTGSGPSVVVEVHLLSTHVDGLRYRTVTGPCDGQHPNRLASELAGFDRAGPDDVSRRSGRVVHSTSWRYDADQLVLTYLALPDPRPALSTSAAPSTGPARSDDPCWPTPDPLTVDHVVAHGCEHLALLSRTDPTIAAAADAEPELWSHLDHHAPIRSPVG
jgi:hypothetical protein